MHFRILAVIFILIFISVSLNAQNKKITSMDDSNIVPELKYKIEGLNIVNIGVFKYNKIIDNKFYDIFFDHGKLRGKVTVNKKCSGCFSGATETFEVEFIFCYDCMVRKTNRKIRTRSIDTARYWQRIDTCLSIEKMLCP